MQRMHKRQLQLITMMLMSATACNDSSENWVPSDIDTSTTVERLGTAGYSKLCGAFADHIRDMYRTDKLVLAACTAKAMQSTSDATSCGDYVDRCVNAVPPEVESLISQALAEAGCQALDIDPATCGVSVSTLTNCLDAFSAELDRAQYSLTCAAFGSPVPSNWYKISSPSACTSLLSQC